MTLANCGTLGWVFYIAEDFRKARGERSAR
jgi:hypothetical protein